MTIDVFLYFKETTVRQHLSALLQSTGRVAEAASCLSEMHWSTQEGSPLKLELVTKSIGMPPKIISLNLFLLLRVISECE